MQQTLWGEKIPHRRRRKNVTPPTQQPYAITDKDCEILGHAVREWDLSGCTICLDCGVTIFCPGCIAHHPQDDKAVPLCCTRHSESQVIA